MDSFPLCNPTVFVTVKRFPQTLSKCSLKFGSYQNTLFVTVLQAFGMSKKRKQIAPQHKPSAERVFYYSQVENRVAKDNYL